jgi:hypothetical protein
MIKHLTTIDFGQLVYEDDILKTFDDTKGWLRMVSHEKIEGSVDNRMQAAWLTVLVKEDSKED